MPPQLPVDLENEILSRLPPQSLVRFRSVCKRWNSLLKDKNFVNNYSSRSRPQLVFYANYKAYLIDVIDLDLNSIGPRIDLHDLPSFDLPLQDSLHVMTTCDELLFCSYLSNKVMGFWNPLLKQGKWFEYENEYLGVGYDNRRPEKSYKVLAFVLERYFRITRAAIFDCESQVFKFIDLPDSLWPPISEQSTVSLNGNLYCVYFNHETNEYFIQSFDFSMETFKPFCLLPCQKSHKDDLLVLARYKADMLSLLRQSFLTNNIEIWITKNKICRVEKDVVWIKLMTLPTTNLTRRFTLSQPISYFIYDKTLYMCCDDYETGIACIYIVREDLCKKIQIGSSIVYCRHSVYTPNFITVPYFRG